MTASTLILADDIETIAMRIIGTGQFVVGDSKVRPRIGGAFRRDETLGVYLQAYNLGTPQGKVTYEVLKVGTDEVVVTTTEDIAQNSGRFSKPSDPPRAIAVEGFLAGFIHIARHNNRYQR